MKEDDMRDYTRSEKRRILILSILFVVLVVASLSVPFGLKYAGYYSNDVVESPTPIKEVAIEDRDDASLEDLQKELNRVKAENPQVVKEDVPVKVIKKKDYYIFMGTFKTNYFYENMVEKLKAEGLTAITSKSVLGGEPVRSIKVGPMSRKEAYKVRSELIKKGFPQGIFIRGK